MAKEQVEEIAVQRPWGQKEVLAIGEWKTSAYWEWGEGEKRRLVEKVGINSIQGLPDTWRSRTRVLTISNSTVQV